MIRNILIGLEEGNKYYVQSCCGEEHIGQSCDCKSYAEGLSKKEAISLANKKSKELNIPVIGL